MIEISDIVGFVFDREEPGEMLNGRSILGFINRSRFEISDNGVGGVKWSSGE